MTAPPAQEIKRPVAQIESVWVDDGARQLFEHIQTEIARAFIVPTRLLHDAPPNAYDDFIRVTRLSTQYLLKAAIDLHEKNTRVILMIEGEL